MTSPSPTIAANFQPNLYYPDDDTYLYAMADVLKREYRAIVDAGFVLQVDCIGFGTGTRSRDASTLEIRREVARNVEVLNYALADIPSEQVRMHMCWGSDAGPHTRDGELRDMADLLITAKPAGITLVGASGRHEHEWKVWQDLKLPEDKVIIAGVIDHTTNSVEHPETGGGSDPALCQRAWQGARDSRSGLRLRASGWARGFSRGATRDVGQVSIAGERR